MLPAIVSPNGKANSKAPVFKPVWDQGTKKQIPGTEGIAQEHTEGYVKM